MRTLCLSFCWVLRSLGDLFKRGVWDPGPVGEKNPDLSILNSQYPPVCPLRSIPVPCTIPAGTLHWSPLNSVDDKNWLKKKKRRILQIPKHILDSGCAAGEFPMGGKGKGLPCRSSTCFLVGPGGGRGQQRASYLSFLQSSSGDFQHFSQRYLDY